MDRDVELPVIASPLPDYVATVAPPAPPPPSPPVRWRREHKRTDRGPDRRRARAAKVRPETMRRRLMPRPCVDSGPPLLGRSARPRPLHRRRRRPPTPKLVRVGGVIREPRKIVHVAPIYPEIARHARREGSVTLEAILDATGKVESVRVLSAQPLLEDAAVRAVRQWRYTPTELNGVPVPVLMTITVLFSLER